MNPIDLKTIKLEDLAIHVSKVFEESGFDVFLVGGSCVTIYTKNKYQSYDLDFITYESSKTIKSMMKKLNFEYDTAKYFKNPECEFFVEFLTPPVSIGEDNVEIFHKRKTAIGTLKMLTPLDCVKDRLLAFFHWDDQQSLEQAVLVAKDQNIDRKHLIDWAKKENMSEKLKIFLNLTS
jgi:hypothetical protein